MPLDGQKQEERKPPPTITIQINKTLKSGYFMMMNARLFTKFWNEKLSNMKILMKYNKTSSL